MRSARIVLLGSFDPLHAGHISLITEAKKYGDVHILLLSDDWVVARKGHYFQPWEDRKRVIEAFVDDVHRVDNAKDMMRTLEKLKPKYFGCGEEESTSEIPHKYCKKKRIETLFRLGGAKYNASSAINSRKRVETRWGSYDVLIDMPLLKVKLLRINPGEKLSLQRHQKRSEFFFMPNGEVRVNLPGVWHAPKAPEDRPLTIVEVQVGSSVETDIERVSERSDMYENECQRTIELNQFDGGGKRRKRRET